MAGSIQWGFARFGQNWTVCVVQSCVFSVESHQHRTDVTGESGQSLSPSLHQQKTEKMDLKGRISRSCDSLSSSPSREKSSFLQPQVLSESVTHSSFLFQQLLFGLWETNQSKMIWCLEQEPPGALLCWAASKSRQEHYFLPTLRAWVRGGWKNINQEALTKKKSYQAFLHLFGAFCIF